MSCTVEMYLKCWNSVLDYRARVTNCLISVPWPISTMKHSANSIMCFIMAGCFTNSCFPKFGFFFKLKH